MSDKLSEAIKLIKSGNKTIGKQYLTEVLKIDPNNQTAWLWMSAVVDTDDLRRECLEEVLKIDPNNLAAKRGLAQLPQRQSMSYEFKVQESKQIPIEIPRVESAADKSFKFRYVIGGQPSGFLSQAGKATGQELLLGEESLSYDEIVDTTVRDDRLLLAISPKGNLGKKLSKAMINGNLVAREVYKVEALNLERHIDRICSRRKAETNRQRLIDAGKGELFRFAVCPECHAIIDLSELGESRYTYCRFCETIFTRSKEISTKGSVYRICNECGMFDRVRGYTEFYFYFLLVAYGFSMKRRYVCDNCADSIFRKTLLLNLIFLLGVPSSIYLKLKSLTGREPFLRELAKANALARKGRYKEAAPIFTKLQSKYPEHPGLLLDEGMGYLAGKNYSSAVAQFKRALMSCNNYLPVLQLMQRIQNSSHQAR
jgi:tetratricopeptide (TPR) repeat protein